ncbi:hypothetical protein PV325_000787 [Microctonus aethiopoides]|nr:hypothetical protein PV325_000787 [Microctonus aethiopoides]
MAEVIAKKSTNVVSNNKSDVCDAKSNSVLIDFDKITENNSQLIHVCDDDVNDECELTNNANNLDEQSLQELIERELDLRICPNNECETQPMSNGDGIENGELGNDFSLPNASFIEREIDYCNISHELSKNPNQNSDNDTSKYNNSINNGVLENKKSIDIIDNKDVTDKCEMQENFVTDKLIDDFLHIENSTDVKEITQNLLDIESSANCDTNELTIDQHSTNKNYLENESLNDSVDYLYSKLSEFDGNKVETIRLLDKVSELTNNPDIIEPLLSFDIDNVKPNENSSMETIQDANSTPITINNPVKIIEYNNTTDDKQQDDSFCDRFSVLSDKNIDANADSTMTQVNDTITYSKINHQYTEINSTEFQSVVNTNMDNVAITNDTNNHKEICNTSVSEICMSCDATSAELPISDDIISDELSNVFDQEIREEVITTSSTLISTTTKNSTKTKKKKIDGNVDNDALPINTPRTKKTKKSKKNDLEKENISVNINNDETSMNTSNSGDYVKPGETSNMDDLSNVNVKSLTQCYATVSARYGAQENCKKEAIETGISIKLLLKVVPLKAPKSSFNKFDALSKKSILNVRSMDSTKAQQQLNLAGQNGDTNPNCRSCDKVVFQMEQTKAEGLIWHKNCFRCVQCSKQLSVDNYQSHECTLYCKAHFKELFQPKPVDESNQPVCPRKPEMIIRENQPKELPPDVARASDKPDLGLEELSSLNVKSRFQVFEKKSGSETNDIEKSPSQISVKRSPSILSKLAKFQAKGMDIGVADESLNGIPYEESSESDEEEDIEELEDTDVEIIKSKRVARERPISFSKMDDMKSRWEVTTQRGKRESQREARKEEIVEIRSKLFMGKQGKMKEMYQQAVATSERVTKINPAEEIQCSTHARSIKEKFERGEPIADSDDQDDNKVKQEKPDEDVIAAGISRKSRTLFLELDASAAKAGGPPVTPANPKTFTETPRRARDVSSDVVRSTDATEEVQVQTSDISNKFKFFETYKEPEQQRKQFRITPPRDGQVKMNSPEREIYRDPDVVRADDRLDNIVHTDTTKKMLSIFRQMEEKATKEDVPDGPKPLKRFTPPPEDKYAKATASDSEEDGEEDGIESGADSEEERNPNYVEDEFLKQAQNAAKAKTLRAKFEQWETNDEKIVSHNNITEMEIAQSTSGENASIESARSLRARFESLGSQSTELPRTQKCKVNRFVENQTVTMDACESCQKKVYPLEKVETNNKIFHKHCFRCLQCNCILRMDTFTLNNGKLYCIPHFKQLFIARGNYDEGFGVDPHKNKWSSNANSGSIAKVIPIVISNGTNSITNHD